MKTNLETSTEISKPEPPQAVAMAQELINSRPDLFKNDYATLLAIASTMFKYKEGYTKWENSLSSFSDRIADPLSDVKNQIKAFLPVHQETEFNYINGREESIMDRGCHD